MLPKVIVLATTKGGAGKSTLARSLGAHWLMQGFEPIIIDADPQGSIYRNHNPDGKLSGLKVIADADETVKDTIEDYKETNHPIIVDTGGFSNKTTAFALLASDYALIPFKPSKDDVYVAMQTYKLIKEINQTKQRLKNPIKARMVMTMVDTRTVLPKSLRRDLKKAGSPLLETDMILRQSYLDAAVEGLSPNIIEPEGAAAQDIKAIASEITMEEV